MHRAERSLPGELNRTGSFEKKINNLVRVWGSARYRSIINMGDDVSQYQQEAAESWNKIIDLTANCILDFYGDEKQAVTNLVISFLEKVPVYRERDMIGEKLLNEVDHRVLELKANDKAKGLE
jgi:hypothetical protein